MTVLDWAVAHPLLAFALSWPTALILISIAWGIATVMVQALQSTVSLFTQLAMAAVILIRGHAPVEPIRTDTDEQT